MHLLTRRVRFAVNPGPRPEVASHNGYAGRPAMSGLGRHYELEVACRGELARDRGYLIDIQDIDRATRATLLPDIAAACDEFPDADPAALLAGSLARLDAMLLGRLAWARWFLTPYFSVEVAMKALGTALVRQRFDFAAAHRLHVPSLSADENKRLFGKCNNPNGHGHNYQFEPCVAVPIRADGRPSMPLGDLEALANQTIVDRFDHMNLNEDAPEFRQPGGLNPSVENIAKVFFELLGPAVTARFPGAELRSMTVWETDRTSSTYPA